MKTFNEILYDSYGQEFRVDELLFEKKTDHQHLVIFHNAAYGRVMALDGIIQTTERDEFVYHEMLTHVPLLAHGDAESILIIGGGDGGILREVVRHKSVEQIMLVEIDKAVIEMCRTYLPKHSAGAFDDPRVKIRIDDGFRYVKKTGAQFDVIICDSTDPIGPGEVLFSAAFYRNCQRILKPGGVLVTQNGVPFLQKDEMAITAQRLKTVFKDRHFYTAAIPTYVGGLMAFGWASDNAVLRQIDTQTLENRYKATGLKTKYYTPQLHNGAFCLPQFMLDLID